ncbi:helix-turn-helix transcriptional regulator [Burkholderia multivorans]|uniref:helix-turn-helix transcriptional regulator n=1 Tax=Burkholderia multivorans TaxID=87883 RepID=UPI001FC830B0|nr:PAS domain-containing protein [Burkholderia multivorans]MCA8334840.1 PAS domain-containing protein [Burkholderia multivorans]MDN7475386.1 PAS domain-containing protein [Burkholderia multivorans]UXZ63820.1 PAS domain-containing protein [Burkholderia multivorans]
MKKKARTSAAAQAKRTSSRPAASAASLKSEQASLIEQVQRIAEGLGQMFAPFTEVVVHDLRTPKQAILAIHNNLSGRAVGDPATELGLARIADDDFPPVLANYPNRFADGRTAKSTSIGIKDSSGRYVAALCLNADVTLFRGFQHMLAQFCSTDGDAVADTLDPAGADAIRQRIDAFATRLAATPRELKTEQRRELMQTLKADGLLEIRRAMEIVSQHLGVSRATVYNDAK